MNGISKTKPELEAFILQFKGLLENPQTQGVILVLCDNNLATAEVFVQSGHGLGIGEFSQLAGVSPEAVRHWVEVGLIEPYSLNGKFRFLPPHLLELRSLQQWQSLGLTLDEIKSRKKTGTVFIQDSPMQIGKETIPHATIQILPQDHPQAQALAGQQGEFKRYSKEESEARGVKLDYLRSDYDAQILALEQKKLEMEKQLEKAKHLRAKLEISD
jgi:DNA-binding transcriptional MerR regulator